MTPPCRATAGTQGRTPGDPGHQRRSPGVSQSPRVLLRAHFRALVLVLRGGSEATPSRAAPRSLPAFRQLLPGPTAPPGDAPEGRAEPPRPPQPPPRPWPRPFLGPHWRHHAAPRVSCRRGLLRACVLEIIFTLLSETPPWASAQHACALRCSGSSAPPSCSVGCIVRASRQDKCLRLGDQWAQPARRSYSEITIWDRPLPGQI